MLRSFGAHCSVGYLLCSRAYPVATYHVYPADVRGSGRLPISMDGTMGFAAQSYWLGTSPFEALARSDFQATIRLPLHCSAVRYRVSVHVNVSLLAVV